MGNVHNDRGDTLHRPAFKRQLYTKLVVGEIRTLLLAPGKKNRPVVCELEVASDTKTHQYEALSYVWGTTRADKSIKCNGVTLEITESLYQALLHLRYEKTWRRIWVDQLCIDQGESHELMSQVRNMGSIYSDASRVVVWLGRPDARMMSAWELIRETSLSPSLVRSDFLDGGVSPASTPSKTTPSKSPRLLRSTRRQSSESSRSLQSSPSRSSLSGSTSSLASSVLSQSPRTSSSSSFSLPLSSRVSKTRSASRSSNSSSSSTAPSAKLKHALTIFQHPYFSRKWTFQEIILPRAAVFTCGDGEIAFSDLASWYFHYVGKLRHESLLYDSVGSFGGVLELRGEIGKLREQFLLESGLDLHMTTLECPQLSKSPRQPQLDIRLSHLLMLTRHRSSLKAEDTIYALLGLHPKFSSHLHEINEEEGWLPLPELFLAAFKFCIDDEADLSVLSAAGIYNGNKNAVGKGRYEGWPSWLPDWRETLPLRPLVMTSSGSKLSAIVTAESPTDTSEYRAAGRTTPELRIEDNTEDGRFTLTSKGFRIGIVVIREASWPNSYFVPDQRTQSVLDEKIVVPNVHAQPLSNLTSINENSLIHDYSVQVIAEAINRNEICNPMRSSAAARTGDWIVALLGGPMLYIVRPTAPETGDKMVIDDDKVDVGVKRVEHDTSHTGSDGTPHDEHEHGDFQSESWRASQTPRVTCRFVGECAVVGLMDGVLMQEDEHQTQHRHTIDFEFF